MQSQSNIITNVLKVTLLLILLAWCFLIGTIGGMILHGVIGLFLGAVVLAVMYRMYEYWVNITDKNINQ